MPELERAILSATEKLQTMELENEEWDKAERWIHDRERNIEEEERRRKESERRKSIVQVHARRAAEMAAERQREKEEEAKRGKASWRMEIARANVEVEEARRKALERIRAKSHEDDVGLTPVSLPTIKRADHNNPLVQQHPSGSRLPPSAHLRIVSNLRSVKLAAASAVARAQPPLPDIFEQDLQRRLGSTLDPENGSAYGTWKV